MGDFLAELSSKLTLSGAFITHIALLPIVDYVSTDSVRIRKLHLPVSLEKARMPSLYKHILRSLGLMLLVFLWTTTPAYYSESETQKALLPALNAAQLDGFIPSCEFAAAGLELFRDPEFDQHDLQVVWQVNPEIDETGVVLKHGWVSVAPIDPLTGKFVLDRIQKVEDSKPVRITIINNGPEWGYSQRGSEAFYTAYTADEKTTRLGKVYKNKNENWKVEFLPSSRRKARPEPSKNPLDLRPKIYYSTMIGDFGGGDLSKGAFGWREDRSSFPIDISLPKDFGTGRWMPNSREILHHLTVSRHLGYVSLYDTVADTDMIVASELTWYVGLGAWSAPELNGETAILAATGNAEDERIDLLVGKQNEWGQWVLWTKIITIHPAFPDLSSPEAFVVDGRSYVLLTSRSEPSAHLKTPSIIWIASVDPDLPESEKIRRVVSQEFLSPEITAKADPELIILPGIEAKVYYLDKGLEGDPLLVCDTGLYP